MEGLISERVFQIDMGRWVIERHWDLTHPRCPIVPSPFHSQLQPRDRYIEQRVISGEKYAELYGTRGHDSARDCLSRN